MSTTQEGDTPLLTAAVCGKCDVVTELLDNGADVNAQNDVSPINTDIAYTTSIPHLNNFKSVVTFGIYWSCRMIGIYNYNPNMIGEWSEPS